MNLAAFRAAVSAYRRPTGHSQQELARDLGGGPIDIGQGAVPWVVMADPEGNEFCVLTAREQ